MKLESEVEINQILLAEAETLNRSTMDGGVHRYLPNARLTLFILGVVQATASRSRLVAGHNRLGEKLSSRYAFDHIEMEEMQSDSDEEGTRIRIPSNDTYDFIFGELPLGARVKRRREVDEEEDENREIDPEEELRDRFCGRRLEWYAMSKLLERLSGSGVGLFVLTGNLFFSEQGKRFLEFLEARDVYPSAIVELPKVIDSHVPLVLVCFTRERKEKIFCASLDNDVPVQSTVENMVAREDLDSLEFGALIPKGSFRTYAFLRISRELHAMRSQFADYEFKRINDLVKSYTRGSARRPFVKKENAIYLPITSQRKIICDEKLLEIKQQNYMQLDIRPDKATNSYVASFLDSSFGKKCLRASATGFIEQINWSVLKELEIPVPSIVEQGKVSELHDVMDSLLDAIDSLRDDLSSSPMGNPELHSKLSALLEVVGGENQIQRICRLAREGENKTTEFKQTFHLDVQNGGKNKELNTASLKTIVAFLNTDGGALLIGVADSGEIVGIDNEVSKLSKGSRDRFLLDFKNHLKRRIGEDFYPFIDFRIVDVGRNKGVLCIDCSPADHECYLDGEKFFVRTNPASDELFGPRLVDYVKTRFG